MTREQAEAAGWKWTIDPVGVLPTCATHSDKMVIVGGQDMLRSITSIERYPDTADLLAAAKVLLVGVRNELAEMDVDGGYEHYHAIGSFLTKLEDHHAGT